MPRWSRRGHTPNSLPSVACTRKSSFARKGTGSVRMVPGITIQRNRFLLMMLLVTNVNPCSPARLLATDWKKEVNRKVYASGVPSQPRYRFPINAASLCRPVKVLRRVLLYFSFPNNAPRPSPLVRGVVPGTTTFFPQKSWSKSVGTELEPARSTGGGICGVTRSMPFA